MKNEGSGNLQKIIEIAKKYFDIGEVGNHPDDLELADGSELFHEQSRILSYLQSVFFEEYQLEVLLDRSTRVYFANILDDPPSEHSAADEGGEDGLIETEYEPGSYLKDCDSFLLTPLTPAAGNLQIRSAKRVIVRFFKGATAVEMGCTFEKQDRLDDTPVLRFAFPVIGRINRNFRLYRVKAPKKVRARVAVCRSTSSAVWESYHQIFDMSPEGIGFEISSESDEYAVDQPLRMKVMVEEMPSLEINGTIRSVRKVRAQKGYTTICGVQFDLETRKLATELEKLNTALQRHHLREIALKTAGLEGVRLL